MARRVLKYAVVVTKLEQAFAIGCSVSEACLYAGIARETYYRWTRDNKPLRDRLLGLQDTPILQARQTVVKSLKTDPEMALKYLERKRKKEFSPRMEVEHDAKEGSIFKISIGVHKPDDRVTVDTDGETGGGVDKAP